MTSRERLIAAINHQPVDRIPFDLGSTSVTGIHVSSLHALKVLLGLISPQEPVKVINPLLMLGEVDETLRKKLAIDTIALPTLGNSFGFENDNWKPWKLFDEHQFWFQENLTLYQTRMVIFYNIPKVIGGINLQLVCQMVVSTMIL